MAIRKKYIELSHTVVNQEGQTTDTYWFNQCGEFETIKHNTLRKKELQSPDITIELLKNSGYQAGVQPSDPDAVFKKLNRHLIEKNAVKFQALLETDFIYPGCLSTYPGHGYHSRKEWRDSTGASYRVRPNIEALFIDHLSYFEKLVDNLIVSNDPILYEAFLKSIEKTDICDQKLFLFDNKTKQKVILQLENIQQYGVSLLSEKSVSSQKSGRLALDIADLLTKKLNDKMQLLDISNDYQSQFKVLKFKLEVVSELRKHDKKFDIHTGWHRITNHVCTILLTGRIANLMTMLAEGHTFFASLSEPTDNRARPQGMLALGQFGGIKFKH